MLMIQIDGPWLTQNPFDTLQEGTVKGVFGARKASKRMMRELY